MILSYTSHRFYGGPNKLIYALALGTMYYKFQLVVMLYNLFISSEIVLNTFYHYCSACLCVAPLVKMFPRETRICGWGNLCNTGLNIFLKFLRIFQTKIGRFFSTSIFYILFIKHEKWYILDIRVGSNKCFRVTFRVLKLYINSFFMK